MPTPFPARPRQMIGTDLFQLDNLNYLIVVSSWLPCKRPPNRMKLSEPSKQFLQDMESTEEVRSDNGQQYASAEFTHFRKRMGFQAYNK